MQPLSSFWSQTSSRLMNACPRLWALVYAKPHKRPDAPGSTDNTRPRTLDELLTRTMREVWKQRLADMYNHKIWSPSYKLQAFMKEFNKRFKNANLTTDSSLVSRKIKLSMQQLERLEQTLSLRNIVSGDGKRWAYFDRQRPAFIHGVRLYAAPDVAVFTHHRWTLVRIQFRASPHQGWYQLLEHVLMVHWALQQPGFPDNIEAFRLKVVAWRQGVWVEHQVPLSSTLLKQAFALVEHDVREAKWIERCALADPSLAALPLARHEMTCNICHHRKGCPAGNGLTEAKEEQRIRLVSLSKGSNEVS